jgi:hypothetical protein
VLRAVDAHAPPRGPPAILVSTINQATQAQRVVRDLGVPLGVGAARGTPCVSPACRGDIRFLVLGEVDHLLARNPHEYAYEIVKLLLQRRQQQAECARGPDRPLLEHGSAIRPGDGDERRRNPARDAVEEGGHCDDIVQELVLTIHRLTPTSLLQNRL